MIYNSEKINNFQKCTLLKYYQCNKIIYTIITSSYIVMLYNQFKPYMN